ncbi:MarR family winged helix-turn-helix transcriptional regulator [Sphaerisporangium aureirubrum]|uniref:MarR family winged helix-turn-helix transcriptional regulator n=1 Tax=Sphaerisporangium aureirubrum TaxID=1544736 RepID=A0ABW1NRR5_9ACTN
MTTGRQVAAGRGPVGYALAEATKAHRVELQWRVAALGLHLGQELLIVDIHYNPGTTQAEMVQRIGLEQPTIAKALGRMERAGFVRRDSDPQDRRVIRVRLTDRGEEAVAGVEEAWAEVERRTTGGLSEAESRELIRMLNIIRDSH